VHWVRIESQSSGQIALTISRYHSTSDKRLPAKFICIDCRLRADISWELIKSGVYPQVMTKYRDLALFRHVMNILLCNHWRKYRTDARLRSQNKWIVLFQWILQNSSACLVLFSGAYASSSHFHNFVGAEFSQSRQLLKRLEEEGQYNDW